jgi:hypothetical protein
MGDEYQQTDQFRSDVKQSLDYNTAENGSDESDVEAALRRKAELVDELKFEAAARNGVKA